MRAGGIFRLVTGTIRQWVGLSAKFWTRCSLARFKIASRCHNRQSWNNPIETVLGQLQLMLSCHQSMQYVLCLRAVRWKTTFCRLQNH